MKQARRKAYQFHYEAAMSKVLHEEARKKEEAREAKKNKKRKLLPVVEDPVVKVDRRKFKSRKKFASTEDDDDEAAAHTSGFVIKLKGVKQDDSLMDLDDSESGINRRHSFLAGRPTPRYLPSLPQPPPGETLTASELRAYDRIAKSAEKRFDAFISSVWKDIAKKDIPKAHRQMDMSLKVKQSNAKKTVQLASKEARRWQARSTKASKEMQIKAKKAMREVN
jgi:DNA helicase INO80